ncbi:hypothetical protein IVB41_12240 [Bradyrhizobium sp. 44]|uniref:hypothetical protein n=1 Tax=Bradyrhizobium sp. 44 TaxID=2782675 RepID=UPI001FFB72E0|nr:hypothetical protein [Bradyrhizobium sp. 44]MCK1284686.1 hypothetical protein [Bradyrhizobium sp. 44]
MAEVTCYVALPFVAADDALSQNLPALLALEQAGVGGLLSYGTSLGQAAHRMAWQASGSLKAMPQAWSARNAQARKPCGTGYWPKKASRHFKRGPTTARSTEATRLSASAELAPRSPIGVVHPSPDGGKVHGATSHLQCTNRNLCQSSRP